MTVRKEGENEGGAIKVHFESVISLGNDFGSFVSAFGLLDARSTFSKFCHHSSFSSWFTPQGEQSLPGSTIKVVNDSS